MAHIEPQSVMQLVDVLNDVCHTLASGAGRPVSMEFKDMLAKRILAEFEAGITDPLILKADALSRVPRIENC